MFWLRRISEWVSMALFDVMWLFAIALVAFLLLFPETQ
jgi:hypothetical protein